MDVDKNVHQPPGCIYDLADFIYIITLLGVLYVL